MVGCSQRKTFSHLSSRHDTLTFMIHSLEGNRAISTDRIVLPAGRRVVSPRSKIGSSCQSSVCGIVVCFLFTHRHIYTRKAQSTNTDCTVLPSTHHNTNKLLKTST